MPWAPLYKRHRHRHAKSMQRNQTNFHLTNFFVNYLFEWCRRRRRRCHENIQPERTWNVYVYAFAWAVLFHQPTVFRCPFRCRCCWWQMAGRRRQVEHFENENISQVACMKWFSVAHIDLVMRGHHKSKKSVYFIHMYDESLTTLFRSPISSVRTDCVNLFICLFV